MEEEEIVSSAQPQKIAATGSSGKCNKFPSVLMLPCFRQGQRKRPAWELSVLLNVNVVP